MTPVLAALLIGLFLGSCLTAGAFLMWMYRAMSPHDDSDSARGVGA
jgi:hypothetical protein